MTRQTLDVVISNLIAYTRDIAQLAGVTFIWHGGEPTVAGLNFYRDALAIQEKYAQGMCITNLMQTNGLLLSDEWLSFFKENNFGLSMSIDGPKHIHDKNRSDASGRGSFDRTMAVLSRAKEVGLTPGVVVTINKTNINLLAEIYSMLAEAELAFNVVPIVRSGEAATHFDEFAISPEEWGTALITLFDLWYKADPYIQIDDLVHITRAVITGNPAICHHTRNCSSFNLSVDPKGDVYPCGWLSGHAELRYGSLHENSLKELLSEDIAFSLRTRETPADCRVCEWKSICHGGCMAHSYLYDKDVHGKSYFCESIKMIYGHIRDSLQKGGHAINIRDKKDLFDVLRPTEMSRLNRHKKVIMLESI